jgi:hypothetical protein
MTNTEWVEANLKGKVKARALRACEEQPAWNSNNVESMLDCFRLATTQEGYYYWTAVCVKDTNPDQWLPEDYVDVDHVPGIGEMVKSKPFYIHNVKSLLDEHANEKISFSKMVEIMNEMARKFYTP